MNHKINFVTTYAVVLTFFMMVSDGAQKIMCLPF